MIIVIKPGSPQEAIDEVVKLVEASELRAHVSAGHEVTIVGVVGDKTRLNIEGMTRLRAVEKVVPITD